MNQRARRSSLYGAVLALAVGLLTAVPAHSAEITDGLALWYKLDASAGTVAADSSGNGLDGTVLGTPQWTSGQGLGLNGTDTYVKLPDNVLSGLAEVTVALDVYIEPTQATPYFIYGFGNTVDGAGNGYLFTTGNQYKTAIASGNWSTEQSTGASGTLARGRWVHLAYTLGAGTGVLYEDGAEVARNAGVTLTPGSIGNGATTANAIGRSVYTADRYLKGRVRDFRVYRRALAGTEIGQLAATTVGQNVVLDKAALTLGDTGSVTADLVLPATGPNGSTITWATGDPAVVGADGRITRPPVGQPSAHATLTATIANGGVTETKEFAITVLAESDERQIVEGAAAALAVPGLEDVRGNLSLPTSGPDGTAVAWTSAKPAVITGTGEVHRPVAGAGGTTVALTATVSRNQVSVTRVFTATVPELPPAQPYQGYMFSYFTGEGTATGEQVYFALSKGNNALQWRELNGGNPVLTSTLGEQGLRDPFIIRSPEGDKFYQIATDLRIYGNGNWDAAQRTGSRSIMVWESTDLVHWTDQRLVKVSPDTAGNTWAPEAYYDHTLGAYVVFWASKLYAESDPNHTGSTYNRMMYATTRDFRTFSEPKVWVDPGYSVIDSTMTEHNGQFYRFTKDERNNTSTTPCSKFIIEEKATSILDLSYDFVAECIGKGTINQGEGPTIFKSNTEEKWYLFIDEFGGRGYVPFESTDLDSGVWTPSTNYSLPARPRHGTVMPVTQAEYDRLLRSYAADQLVESVDEVAVLTGVDDPPLLPATVTGHFADGTTKPVNVTWDAVPPSAYAAPGTFTVHGALPDGSPVRAVARVTVTAEPIPVQSLTVTPAELRLGVGVGRRLAATVLPANATARRLTWLSSNSAVATVSDTGVVDTVAPGNAHIIVKTADGSKSVTIPVEVTADIPASLLLRYEFEDAAGTEARDSSGRGNEGRYERTPAFGAGVHGASFKLSGGSSTSTTAPYVTIPNGILAGKDSVTVSTFVKYPSSTPRNQWVFGIGPSDQRYLFATPANGSGVLYSAITTASWQGESKLPTSAALPTGGWQHVTVTVDATTKTAVLYRNGLEVARAANVPIKASDLHDATKNFAGYIGRSLYSGDPYFAGEVDDFRVYDRALSATEVLDLSGNTTAIAGVTLPQLKVDAIIDDAASRIVLPVKEGTALNALAPAFSTATGATVSPASGTTRDFTAPVTYTVTGADGTSRVWTVEALVMRSPVLPGKYADPHIVAFGNRFYLYPTTDGFEGWSGTQFKAFSSSDLVHWEDHGVILDLGPDISWADDRAWAPAIAEKNGKYYFYFSAATNIGVAVADSPTGPFTDPLGRPLLAAGQYPGQMIDPQVFVDDDGSAYLYFGQGQARVVKLGDDMVSFDPAAVQVITPAGYNEASFVFKRAGQYYFTWSENDTRSEDYRVAYATGPSPLGPWTKQGVILQKRLELGVKGPGHHSIVRVPGTDDWYIAYHRFVIPGGNGTNRETTIDRMDFNIDGTIRPVVPTLSSIDPVTVADAGPEATGGEGTAIALTGSSSGAPAGVSWAYTPAAGVDAGATCAFSDPTAAHTTFTCTDDGTYTVSLRAGRSTDTTTVTVTNTAPVLGAPTGPPGPIAIGAPVTITVPVTEPGAGDQVTCTVAWGDDTSSAGTVSSGQCTATHAYAKPGVYASTVAVADDDGGSAGTTLRFTTAYDPNLRTVNGGGSLDTPSGPATFGLVSKYPLLLGHRGEVALRFHVGDVDFSASTYDWLLTVGPAAAYTGSGLVDGAGDFGYTLTVIDGQYLGARGADSLWLRVWNKSTGTVVFDTRTPAPLKTGNITLTKNP